MAQVEEGAGWRPTCRNAGRQLQWPIPRPAAYAGEGFPHVVTVCAAHEHRLALIGLGEGVVSAIDLDYVVEAVIDKAVWIGEGGSVRDGERRYQRPVSQVI